MSDKTWNDQPDAVIGARKIISRGLFVERRKSEPSLVIEVRQGDGVYYVTGGHLFGSQTIRCRDAESVLLVLGAASGGDLPDDERVTLMKNARKE